MGLFLIPIYVRVFSPEAFGIIDLIQSVSSIIAILGILLLESAIQRFYFEKKDKDERNKYISTAFWSIAVLSIIWTFILVAVSKQISSLLFSDIKYYYSIILSALSIPLLNLFAFVTVILRYMKKPLVYSFVIVLQLLFTIGLSIFFVVLLGWGIEGVFYGQLLGMVFAIILAIYAVRNVILIKWNKNFLKDMLRFSLPQFPARIGSISNVYYSRFVMLSYLSLTDIGVFVIAMKLTSVFKLLENAFNTAWYPFFYEQLENNIHHRLVLRQSVKVITILVFTLVLIYGLFAREFLLILTTKDYLGALPLMGLLALSSGILLIKSAVDLGPLITKKTGYTTLTYLLSAAINIIFLYILVPKIGLLGVPLSQVLGSLSMLIASWIISEKLYNIDFNIFVFAISFCFTVGLLLITSLMLIGILLKFIILIVVAFILLLRWKKIKTVIAFENKN